MSALWSLALLGCMKALPDPLAAQRAAAPPPALAEGWPAQARLVLGRPLLDAAMLEAVSQVVEAADAPTSLTMFGLTATITPAVTVTGASLTASDRCVSCLELELTLEGRSVMALENRTGRRESVQPWTATMRGAMEVAFDPATGEVVGRVAAPERWDATFELAALPAGVSSALSELARSTVQQVLQRPELPPISLVRLRDDAPVALAGLRVAPAPEGVAVDFAFPLFDTGEVVDTPAPGEGWVAVVPEATALALLKHAALELPYDPDAPAYPEITGLTLSDEGFALALDLWPTQAPSLRGRPLREPKARPVRVHGRVDLTEGGDIEVVAERAEWGTEEGRPPDLATLLLGRRLLDGLVAGVQATMPAPDAPQLGGVALSAEAERAWTEPGVMLVSGSMTRE